MDQARCETKYDRANAAESDNAGPDQRGLKISWPYSLLEPNQEFEPTNSIRLESRDAVEVLMEGTIIKSVHSRRRQARGILRRLTRVTAIARSIV